LVKNTLRGYVTSTYGHPFAERQSETSLSIDKSLRCIKKKNRILQSESKYCNDNLKIRTHFLSIDAVGPYK